MSSNRVDLVLYMRVNTQALPGLTEAQSLHLKFEDAYNADEDWPYRIEGVRSPKDELWVSYTYSSVSGDECGSDLIDYSDVSLQERLATISLNEIGVIILEFKIGVVAWYDGSDRPFPKRNV